MTAPTSAPAPHAVLYLVQLGGAHDPDLDFDVVAVEGSPERIFGRSVDAMVGRRMRILFPVAGLDPFLRDFAAVMASGETLVREAPTKLGVLPISWLWYQASRVGDRLRLEMRDLTEDKLVDVRRTAAASQRELLFDRSPIGVVIHGPDGRIVDANVAFSRLAGVERDLLLGRYLRDMLATSPESVAGESYRTQLTAVTGVVHPVEVQSALLPHGYQQLLVRDLTALEESEERFRAAFDNAGSGMALATRDGRNLRVNRALTTILGYSEAELLALTWKDVIHPDDLDAALLNWEQFDRQHVLSTRSEKRYFHRDGHVVWAQLILSMIRDNAGNPLYFLAQIDDISEQRRLAAALRDSEERFRSAFEQSAVGMALLSPAAETLRINQALADLLGYDYESARVLQWHDILHPDDLAEAGSSLRRVASGELPSSRAERRYLRRDRSAVWVHVTVSSVLDPSGAPLYLLAQIEDISERRRLTSERQQMEERLELVLDATRDGIWDWDCTTSATFLGPQWFGMLGYPAEGRVCTPAVFTALVHPDDLPAVWTANEHHRLDADAGIYDQTFRMHRADGTWAWIRSRGRVVARGADGQALRMVGTHTDVSEQRALEEQYRQAQKMEAVGKLAGGVAHDFNNLLAAISATSELLLEDLDAEDPRRGDVQNIALACDRAKTLTRQLLSFSRQEVERVHVVSVDDVVDEISPLLQRLMGPDQRLEIRRAASGTHVRLDPAQLELALINLVANARDAMPAGGDVVIATDVVGQDGEVVSNLSGLRPGRHVRITVRDSGTGMSLDVQRHLFEPFFTTKPQGKGTGLGLATVYGFVQRQGGAVTFESSDGRGSTFTLHLPVVPTPDPEHRVTPAPAPVRHGGARRVLVVDDEAVVRGTTRRLLERRGFVVIEAPNADDALSMLDADAAVDVVLSDHAMPGRTGRQLLADVEQRFPHVRRVLMSGFAADGAVREVLRDREIPFVAKPFTIDELMTAIGD